MSRCWFCHGYGTMFVYPKLPMGVYWTPEMHPLEITCKFCNGVEVKP